MSNTLCLDPGHQSIPNPDTGCSGFNLHEEDVTLDICKRAKPLAEFNGIKVVMTREGGTVNGDGSSLNASLDTRCQIANSANVDLFLSVHCDAFNSQAYGTTVHIYGAGGNAERFAKILSPLMGQLFYNRGIKVSNFQVLRDTNMPAALLETAFLDNADDNAKLADPNVRQQIAVNIVKSVCAYFGIVYKEQSQTQPIPVKEVKTAIDSYTRPAESNNITLLNGNVGWIETLDGRVIIHYDAQTYISIEDGSIYAYAKGKDAVKLI